MYRAERRKFGVVTQKGGYVVRLFVNEKEVPTLVDAIENLIAVKPQCAEAQELLERIFVCVEKQGRTKTK